MNPKIPPHNLDAERSLLGALLINKDSIYRVVGTLEKNHFYRDIHGFIFESALSLFEKHEPVDLITLTNELKQKKLLEKIGGASYLTELTEAVPSSSHVEHYAKIIRDYSIKRDLIDTSSRIVEMGFDETLPLEELMDMAQQSLFSISEVSSKQKFLPIKHTLKEAFDKLDELQKNPAGVKGVPTGLKGLDNKLSGLQDSNMIVLAARPSVGKTSLALNIAQHAAVKHKIPVGIFSLETSREQLVQRMLSSQADVDSWRLSTGRLEEGDFERLGVALGELDEAPIYIDDTPGMSVSEMRAKARRLQMETGLKLLIVDYLQLAKSRSLENRVQEISEVSQGLKNLARELNIPLIAVSQLSRAVESRGEKRPQLSDLRESGSIEQDADVVMFLYREDDQDRSSVRLLISKHRNGPTGELPLFFRGERTKFYEVDERGE